MVYQRIATAGLGRAVANCSCKERHGPTQLVVLTGGPGAGKTAVLEFIKHHLCSHVEILHESASILFGGGFPRPAFPSAVKGAQRAIYHVQNELEQLATENEKLALALCDRGTVDGLAYWPGEEEEFFSQLKTTKEKEFSRYKTVIHLRTPPEKMYDHSNPIRIETAQEAAQIDKKIEVAWDGHPHRFFINSSKNFYEKIKKTLQVIVEELPPCCQYIPLP